MVCGERAERNLPAAQSLHAEAPAAAYVPAQGKPGQQSHGIGKSVGKTDSSQRGMTARYLGRGLYCGPADGVHQTV